MPTAEELAAACRSPSERSERDNQTVLGLLRQYPILGEHLDPPELEQLARVVAVAAYDVDDTVCDEGITISAVYVVLQGSLQLTTSAGRRSLLGASGDQPMLGAAMLSEPGEPKYAHTATPRERCQILVVRRTDVEGARNMAARANVSDTLAFLRQFSCLDTCDDHTLEALMPHLTWVRAAPGEVIIHQQDDDPGAVHHEPSMFFVKSGYCKVTKVFADGNEVYLARLSPLSLFGEIAALGLGAATATVSADTAVVAASLPQSGMPLLPPAVHSALLSLARVRMACARALADRTEEDVETLQAFTAGLKFFQELDADMRHELCRVMIYERCDSGGDVFRQGDPAHSGMYVILNGHVGIFIVDQDDPTAPERMVHQQGGGTAFGELALMHSAPRAATVRALVPTELLRIERKDYNRILRERDAQKMRDVLEFMQRVPAFAQCSRELDTARLVQLSYYFKRITVYKKQVVVREGDAVDGLYFVKSGECAVTKMFRLRNAASHPDAPFAPTSVAVVHLRENECFGDIALLSSGALSVDVEQAEDDDADAAAAAEEDDAAAAVDGGEYDVTVTGAAGTTELLFLSTQHLLKSFPRYVRGFVARLARTKRRWREHRFEHIVSSYRGGAEVGQRGRTVFPRTFFPSAAEASRHTISNGVVRASLPESGGGEDVGPGQKRAQMRWGTARPVRPQSPRLGRVTLTAPPPPPEGDRITRPAVFSNPHSVVLNRGVTFAIDTKRPEQVAALPQQPRYDDRTGLYDGVSGAPAAAAVDTTRPATADEVPATAEGLARALGTFQRQRATTAAERRRAAWRAPLQQQQRWQPRRPRGGGRRPLVHEGKKTTRMLSAALNPASSVPLFSPAVVLLAGLPPQLGADDLVSLFDGLGIRLRRKDVCLVRDPASLHGRSTGEAFVQFADRASEERVLKYDRARIGSKAVRVMRSSAMQRDAAVARLGRRRR